MIDPHNHGWWLDTILMVILSTWAGTVSYLRMLVKGVEFKVVSCVSHLSSSALAGLITVLLCDQYELSVQWTGVACALSGHMGAEAMKIFEDRIKRKASEISL
ncbi:MAG TPA: phage holin family protein [Gallionella sp.]|nr:phage holin family protein [Gallionella sp.]